MGFNNSQQRAITHKDGPALVLAGPGSGKTTVITQRTYNLIRTHGVNPSNILVITFTKAAAQEMKQRFAKLTGGDCGSVTFGTFHAVYFMVLKYAYHFQSSNIISEEKKYQFMREILSSFRLEYEDEAEFIGNLLGEISTIKNTRIPIENFYSAQCGEEIFRKIYLAYREQLTRHKLIDFDDMLLYTYELFQERKDILSSWQRKYKYILVDEFQDINQIQYDILRMLARPENNLFIVGDDDQSIYRFRGSKPEIMLNFERDYPGLQRILLDTNYRCQKQIVDTSLNLISYNKERFSKQIRASQAGAQPVRFLEFENQRQENLFIIREIEQGLQNGKNYEDYAILFRTNTQPRLLMEQMMEYNILFKTRDRVPNLYDHWAVKDVFTYIRIAQGSRERKEFLQIMNRPKRYIGRDSLSEVSVNFESWKRQYQEQPWIAERIDRLEYDVNLIGIMSPYAAINYIRKGVGYDEFLKEYADYRHMKLEDLYDILDELQSTARGFKSYDQWQEHIAKYMDELKKMAELKNQNPNAVSLATLHSAKGLEFTEVYLIDVNEGLMPYKKAVLDKDLEEERRMFYVGMTRAKENLTICSVKNYNNKKLEYSRFLKECKISREAAEKLAAEQGTVEKER